MNNKILIMSLAAASSIFASGGSGGGGGVPVPGTAELRISSELVPAGGTAQVKYSFTNPEPIMSGGIGMDDWGLFGISLWSPAGDAAGVGLTKAGKLFITTVSPLGDLGSVTDYPFLTVTRAVPSRLAPGTVIPLTASPSLFTALGQLTTTVKPGTLTVGGTFFINNVTPGGGTWAAGTTIRVLGSGFLPNASLRTPNMKFSSFKVVSSTEIDIVLKDTTVMDAHAIQVTSGGLTQTYYSYLRGVPVSEPSKTLLKNIDPIFQLQTHALATAGPFDGLSSDRYPAMALQNPNPGPAAVSLSLTHTDGTVSSSLVVLPSGGRIMDDVASLVGIGSVLPGDVFRLTSTVAIQILGINADEIAGTATPFLPAF